MKIATALRSSRLSRILPPRKDEGELVTTSLRLPEGILGRIDKIVKDSKKTYSRTEVMIYFLRWAIEEHEKEEALALKK